MARGRRKTSYTALTIKWLNKNGLLAGIVERKKGNPKMPTYMWKSVDLFGVIDIIGVPKTKHGAGVFGIQSTSVGALRPHIKKALAEPRLWQWLMASDKVYYHIVAWYKDKKINRWRPRVFQVTCVTVGKKKLLRSSEVSEVLSL